MIHLLRSQDECYIRQLHLQAQVWKPRWPQIKFIFSVSSENTSHQCRDFSVTLIQSLLSLLSPNHQRYPGHQDYIINNFSSSTSSTSLFSPVYGGWVYPALRAPSPRCHLLRTPEYEMSQTSGRGAGCGEDEQRTRGRSKVFTWLLIIFLLVITRIEKNALAYPSSGPPFIRSKTCAGLRSCLNLRRNFTPWLSPLFELTRTRRGLEHDAEVAFQKPANEPKQVFIAHSFKFKRHWYCVETVSCWW